MHMGQNLENKMMLLKSVANAPATPSQRVAAAPVANKGKKTCCYS